MLLASAVTLCDIYSTTETLPVCLAKFPEQILKFLTKSFLTTSFQRFYPPLIPFNCIASDFFYQWLQSADASLVNVHAPSQTLVSPPKRTAPFNEEPGFYVLAGLWLYGNTRLLQLQLVAMEEAIGYPDHTEQTLNTIDRNAESAVLGGKTCEETSVARSS